MLFAPVGSDDAVMHVCQWRSSDGLEISLTWSQRQRLKAHLFIGKEGLAFAQDALDGLAEEIKTSTDIEYIRNRMSAFSVMPRGSPGRYTGLIFCEAPLDGAREAAVSPPLVVIDEKHSGAGRRVSGPRHSSGGGRVVHAGSRENVHAGYDATGEPQASRLVVDPALLRYRGRGSGVSSVGGMGVEPPPGLQLVALHGPRVKQVDEMRELASEIEAWFARYLQRSSTSLNQDPPRQRTPKLTPRGLGEREPLVHNGSIQHEPGLPPSIPGTGESEANWPQLAQLWKNAQQMNEAVTQPGRKIPAVVGTALVANVGALVYAMNNPTCSDKLPLVVCHIIAGGSNFLAGSLALRFSLFKRIGHVTLVYESLGFDDEVRKDPNPRNEVSSTFLNNCSPLPQHVKLVRRTARLVASEIGNLKRDRTSVQKATNQAAQRKFEELSQVFSVWHIGGVFFSFATVAMNMWIATYSSQTLCHLGNSTTNHSSNGSEEDVSHTLSHYSLIASAVTLLAFAVFIKERFSRTKTVTVYV